MLVTAPMPVATPQPSRQILSSGAALSTLATLSQCRTVYSEKVEVPICMPGGDCQCMHVLALRPLVANLQAGSTSEFI